MQVKGFTGHVIMAAYPNEVFVNRIKFWADPSSGAGRIPGVFKVFGSNSADAYHIDDAQRNDAMWNEIYYKGTNDSPIYTTGDLARTVSHPATFAFPNTHITPYRYYAIVIQKLRGYAPHVDLSFVTVKITEIELMGGEQEYSCDTLGEPVMVSFVNPPKFSSCFNGSIHTTPIQPTGVGPTNLLLRYRFEDSNNIGKNEGSLGSAMDMSETSGSPALTGGGQEGSNYLYIPKGSLIRTPSSAGIDMGTLSGEYTIVWWSTRHSDAGDWGTMWLLRDVSSGVEVSSNCYDPATLLTK